MITKSFLSPVTIIVFSVWALIASGVSKDQSVEAGHDKYIGPTQDIPTAATTTGSESATKSTPMQSETILVTGGAGFIGSHCVHELLNNNYNVIVVDNCVNAAIIPGEPLPESLKRVEELTGKKLAAFHLTDITDEKAVEDIFANSGGQSIKAVIHLAALKAVGESVQIPLLYYQNNLMSSIALLKIMSKYNVTKFIFSSSATVYGVPTFLPITEEHSTGQSITNPYGRTKYMIEEMLKDAVKAAELNQTPFQVISLRYFNPIGAHPSGRIGEDPKGMPNNLMPFVAQVAVGRRPHLNVFGSSFKTVDGTGVRDYIHIMDLAAGHVSALDYLLGKSSKSGLNSNNPGTRRQNYFEAINLGSGNGYSVLEMVKAFEAATGVKIKYQIVEPRDGDVDSMFADATKAEKVLGWKTKLSIADACRDMWKWQRENPSGFVADGSCDININNNNNNDCGKIKSNPVPGTGIKQVY